MSQRERDAAVQCQELNSEMCKKLVKMVIAQIGTNMDLCVKYFVDNELMAKGDGK